MTYAEIIKMEVEAAGIVVRLGRNSKEYRQAKNKIDAAWMSFYSAD